MPTYSVNYDLLSDDNHEIRNDFSNFIKKFNKKYITIVVLNTTFYIHLKKSKEELHTLIRNKFEEIKNSKNNDNVKLNLYINEISKDSFCYSGKNEKSINEWVKKYTTIEYTKVTLKS